MADSLLALVEARGVTMRAAGAREWHGPCPRCGGDDRFRVREYQGREWWACRKCHEKAGDAIDLLRWLDGLTYRQACERLRIEPRSDRPARAPAPTTPAGLVVPDVWDEAPSAEWQEKVGAWASECMARLWRPEGARALAWLTGARCLTPATVAAAGLGFSPAPVVIAGQWRAAAGVVIPRRFSGVLWGVNVRRATGTPKYLQVTGSRVQLTYADRLADADVTAALVCGGEFDALVAHQAAPLNVCALTFGSETKRPTFEAEFALRGRVVMVAFDNDDAGDAGARAWAGLGARRVRVPSGKDISDYAAQGGDVAGWIAGELSDAIEAAGGVPVYDARGRLIAAPDGAEVGHG